MDHDKVGQGMEKLFRDRAILCRDRVGQGRDKFCRDRRFLGRNRAGHEIGALLPTIEPGTQDRVACMIGNSFTTENSLSR